MLVPPSPKFQLQDVGLLVDKSVKLTESGAEPDTGDPLKSATRGRILKVDVTVPIHC